MKSAAMVAIWLAVSWSTLAYEAVRRPFSGPALPRLCFTNASLVAVAEAMEREYNAQAEKISLPKISILVNPACTNILVTAALDRLSVLDALAVLKQMYGINHVTLENTIILTWLPSGPMISRIYDMCPSWFLESHGDQIDVTGYFAKLGMTFPEGARATYFPGIGKLLVRNTRESFGDFEDVLSALNVVPSLIESTCRVVRVNDAQLAKQVQLSPTLTNMEAIACQSDVLLNLTTITTSGHTSSNAVTSSGSSDKSSGVPTGSASFVVTPCWSAVESLLTVPFEVSFSLPDGKHRPVSYRLSSSPLLFPGATMLFWLSPPADNDAKTESLCLVISARLVDPAGRPMRPPGAILPPPAPQ